MVLIHWIIVLLATHITPAVGWTGWGNMSEGDGAAAHTDVVWSCRSAYCTGLSSTFPSPTALFPSFFSPAWSVWRCPWTITVPWGNVQLCKGLGHPQLVLSWFYGDIVDLKNEQIINMLFNKIYSKGRFQSLLKIILELTREKFGYTKTCRPIMKESANIYFGA